jgi:hypothetical protein
VQLEKNGTSCRSLIALLYYFIQASDALFAGVEAACVIVNSRNQQDHDTHSLWPDDAMDEDGAPPATDPLMQQAAAWAAALYLLLNRIPGMACTAGHADLCNVLASRRPLSNWSIIAVAFICLLHNRERCLQRLPAHDVPPVSWDIAETVSPRGYGLERHCLCRSQGMPSQVPVLAGAVPYRLCTRRE